MRRSAPAVARLRQRLSDEAGFGMIEVLVSAIVLLILSMATLQLLDGAQATSQNQASRGVASSLAHSDLDRVRQMPLEDVEGLDQVRDVPLNGVTFHVATRADWTSDSNTVISCTSADSTGGQYLRISSTVTWPGMQSIKPVTAESIMTPRAGDLDPRYGSLAVQVQDHDGKPLAGTLVSVQGQSMTTGPTGCVTFGRLVEGDSTLTWSQVGYVTQTSTSPGTDDVTIVRNTKGSAYVSLGLATSIPITVKKDASTNGSWTSVSVKSGTFRQRLPLAGPGPLQTSFTASSLYPWAGGYSVYAGDCIGNDPTTYGVNAATFVAAFPGSSVASAPGTSTAGASAYLRATPSFTAKPASSGGKLNYSFKVRTAASQMNRTAPETPCTGSSTGTVGSLAAGGTGTIPAVSLPYGIWDGCVDNGVKRSPAFFVNNTPDGGTPAPTTSIGASPPVLPATTNVELTVNGTCP
jgi:Tfp pilus assembly protein PilV